MCILTETEKSVDVCMYLIQSIFWSNTAIEPSPAREHSVLLQHCPLLVSSQQSRCHSPPPHDADPH